MKTRRTFRKEFKTKIVLEALSEKCTISELAQRHQIQVQQITNWKKLLVDNASLIFEGGQSPSKSNPEHEIAELNEQLKQHQKEIEFLKNASRVLEDRKIRSQRLIGEKK